MTTPHTLFDHIYQKEGHAPWTFPKPPQELVDLVERGAIQPCTTLDIGCGEGYLSLYLASRGFDVTGIDISAHAIKLAQKHAAARKIKCTFIHKDWKQLAAMSQKFDFILDWRFLHEITNDTEREEYVKVVSHLLKKSGTYLSVAFSGEFKKWGTGKLRKSPIGAILCLPQNTDLEKLFAKDFDLLENKMIKLPQKDTRGGVTSYFRLMEKK